MTEKDKSGKAHTVVKKKAARKKVSAGESGAAEEHAGLGVVRSGKEQGKLWERIKQMRRAETLPELKMVVNALRVLVEEHLEQLDEARSDGAADEDGCYSSMLETHGKRIQSLIGELVATIERLGRIEDRKRMLLTAEEVAGIIEKVRDRVIAAVEACPWIERNEECPGRLADAFSSVEVASGAEAETEDHERRRR